ncbi:MAG: outer membrane beta-barrel protein, partial [Deltaproteobacteria bacterium]|nr:outer membrane beta-barrel protein [Deltaproteobacteria bacterium]
MKKLIFMLLAGALFLFTGAASAEMAAGGATVADALKDVKINGFASMGYNQNLNKPHSRAINFRPFNNKDKSFGVEVAQLVFRQDAVEKGSSGFKLDLNFGNTVPQAIHSTGNTGDLDLKQAYVSYVADIGSGLKLDFGKFITEMGGEVIEGYEDWNYNYSRSLIFYYAIPYTHTGARGTYAFNDMFSLTGEVINGWDNVTDNNGSKSICLHASVMPVKDVAVHLLWLGGPEQTDNDSNKRNIYEANVTASNIKDVVLKLDFVYGKEANVDVPAFGPVNATWSGIAAVARYSLSDKHALNVRA